MNRINDVASFKVLTTVQVRWSRMEDVHFSLSYDERNVAELSQHSFID